MRGNISYELNRVFGNNLSEQGIELVSRYLRNRNISFSAIQVDLICKILGNEVVGSVLAPIFEFSITSSWVEDKRIVVYEENSEIIDLSKDIWLNKNADILNENFLDKYIKEKFSAIVLTCPSGWIRRDGQRSIRLEKEYINKCLDNLSENGTFVVTVPSNFLTAPLFSDTIANIRII